MDLSLSLKCFFVLILGSNYVRADHRYVVAWTQQSHNWTKTRGVYDDLIKWATNEKKYVDAGSIPTQNQEWHSLTIDPFQNHIYWHDRKTKSIYQQSIVENLILKQSDSIKIVYTDASAKVGGLAVDWFTGTIYWADIDDNLIGKTVFTKTGAKDVKKVIISKDLSEPKDIQIIPAQGLIFWDNSGLKRIERSKIDGTERKSILQYSAEKICLTLDLDGEALYWVESQGSFHELYKSYIRDNYLSKIFVQRIDLPSILAIAFYQNSIFVSAQNSLTINVYNNSNGDSKLYELDAYPKDIVIAKIPKEITPPDCFSNGCDHFCLDGTTRPYCRCGDEYFEGIDGKSCEKNYDGKKIIWSEGSSLWISDVDIDSKGPHKMKLNSKLLTDGYGMIKAIDVHFEKKFVYFADMISNEIYKMNTNGKDFPIITVNTRKVEGISVDWLNNRFYWADYELGHIMSASLDGRHHRIEISNAGRPRGLAVNPIHGFMYWINEDGSSIMKAFMNGSDVAILLDAESLYSQGIKVDTRLGRLYWTMGKEGMIRSTDLEGEDALYIQSGSTELFGVTPSKDYIIWTEENGQPKAALESTRETIDISRTQFPESYELRSSYGIASLDRYLQPNTRSNPCETKNGGCAQICVTNSKTHVHNWDTAKQCSCAIGYTLAEDGFSCITDLDWSHFIIFTDPYHKQIYQHEMTNTKTVQAIPTALFDFVHTFDIDIETGYLYWIDDSKKELRYTDFLGYKDMKILDLGEDEVVGKMALDYKKKAIYYTLPEEGKIVQVMYNEKNPLALILANNVGRPESLAVDIFDRLLYFTDSKNRRISAMNLQTNEIDPIHYSDFPHAIAIPHSANNTVICWSENNGDIILYNITSQQKTSLYSDNGMEIIALAMTDSDIYFTAQNEKGIFSKSYYKDDGLKHIGSPIFARITDLKVVIHEIEPPSYHLIHPAYWGLIAALAALFLLLLILLIGFCVKKRYYNKKPEEQSIDDEYYNNVFARSIPEEHLNTSTENLMDSNRTKYKKNSKNVPPVHLSEIFDQNKQNSFTAEVLEGKTKLKSRINNKNPSVKFNDFTLSEDQKVATVISRITNRLRNRLSTIRWKGNEPNKPPAQDVFTTETSADHAPPQTGFQKQTKRIQAGRDYQPQLHPPIRGFAPASRVTPQAVKNTWGRARAALTRGMSRDVS